jgi:hypothetical protein
MNSKSWICVQVACYAYASSTPPCLGCSICLEEDTILDKKQKAANTCCKFLV